MTIRIQQKSKTTKIQFVLPDEVHDGAVSAVGSFNDWVPGVHRLVRRSNGTRSVSIDVPRGEEVRFRYLGSGGVWFDDPDADEITPEGLARPGLSSSVGQRLAGGTSGTVFRHELRPAIPASSVRLRAPLFRSADPTCFSTVFTEMCNCSAISLSGRP